MPRPKSNRPPGSNLVVEAGVVGHPTPTEFKSHAFNPDYPYTYCRICGQIFQPPSQREPNPPPIINTHYLSPEPNDNLQKKLERRNWAVKHERRHEKKGELQRFQRSGQYMTPEATHRLAPFGIFSPSEMALDPDTENAGNTAPRMPTPSTNVAHG